MQLHGRQLQKVVHTLQIPLGVAFDLIVRQHQYALPVKQLKPGFQMVRIVAGHHAVFLLQKVSNNRRYHDFSKAHEETGVSVELNRSGPGRWVVGRGFQRATSVVVPGNFARHGFPQRKNNLVGRPASVSLVNVVDALGHDHGIGRGVNENIARCVAMLVQVQQVVDSSRIRLVEKVGFFSVFHNGPSGIGITKMSSVLHEIIRERGGSGLLGSGNENVGNAGEIVRIGCCHFLDHLCGGGETVLFLVLLMKRQGYIGIGGQGSKGESGQSQADFAPAS
mmetsp:Transcript_13387/g.36916  ORF Transcript_13387/g.36916 Transcript_13387/m.36916 type:complete len:279 (+) Transcript_13387:1442-2278(+)